MKNDVLKHFYDEFSVGQVLKKKEIKSFLEAYYGKLKEPTLTWRIYDLKKEGYLKSNHSNSYMVLNKELYMDFEIDVERSLMKLLRDYNDDMKTLKKIYPDERNINISVWNTDMLNKYSNHQVFRNYYIVEIDRSRIKNLFFYLKSRTDTIVVMKRTHEIADILRNGSIVINNLPLKSPIQQKQSQKNDYVGYPKVEKILVDVFVYNKSILPYDGSEIENIYRNIYNRHIVKTKTVLNYARIRGLKTRSSVEDMLMKIGEL